MKKEMRFHGNLKLVSSVIEFLVILKQINLMKLTLLFLFISWTLVSQDIVIDKIIINDSVVSITYSPVKKMIELK